MSKADPPPDELHQLAVEFGDKLNHRLPRILPDPPEFSAVVLAPDRRHPAGHVWLSTLADAKTLTQDPIQLRIAGKHRLDLRVTFECSWDSGLDYLAIEESRFEVDVAREGNPLLRYEYQRRAETIPVAHLHVHASRDEAAYLMVIGERARAKRRAKSDRVPRLADLHLPMGGHRFRPCLEDLLHTLIEEFGVETVDGWESAINEGRAEWRRLQVSAATRDAPEDAARALRNLGYKVTAPVTVRENIERLTAL